MFGQDGSFKSTTPVFSSGTRAEHVGGMVTYSWGGFPGTTSVVVVATDSMRESAGGSIGRPIFRSLTLSENGSLTNATSVMPLNTHWCFDTDRDCRPAGIALGYRDNLMPPAIYVVNRAYNAGINPPRWGFAVTKVNGGGVEQPDGSGQWRHYEIDGTTERYNNAVAVAVRTTGWGSPESPFRDHVFVAAEIKRGCGNGIVVARYANTGYTTDSAIFGGSAAAGVSCVFQGYPTDYPIDMEISGSRLAVVGYGKFTNSTVTPPRDVYTGSVAVLDIGSSDGLSLADCRDYPHPISGSAEYRDTALWGVVPTTDVRFVVVGDVRYLSSANVAPSLRGKSSVATLGIALDRIFGNGLQGPAICPCRHRFRVVAGVLAACP